MDQQVRPFSEVKKGYTYFGEGDVLFAKITPCTQNGKAAIARGLTDEIGFGSTEFHVLRPKDDVLSEWIFYFIRQERFREEAQKRFRGAVGQQRVPQEFLENYSIPVPSTSDEQQRIVAKIEALFDRIREAKRLRTESLEGARLLVQSALNETFERKNGWKRHPLGELVTIEAGLVDPRLPDYQNLPHISGNVIEPVTGRLLSYRTAQEDDLISSKYLFSEGEILYSKIRPYLRKATTVDFSGLCSADVYPLRVLNTKRLLPEFLRWALVSRAFTQYATNVSGRARMPKINREQLFAYPFHLPEPDEQRQIVGYLNQVASTGNQLEVSQEGTDAELKRLEQSILDRAFRGDI